MPNQPEHPLATDAEPPGRLSDRDLSDDSFHLLAFAFRLFLLWPSFVKQFRHHVTHLHLVTSERWFRQRCRGIASDFTNDSHLIPTLFAWLADGLRENWINQKRVAAERIQSRSSETDYSVRLQAATVWLEMQTGRLLAPVFCVHLNLADSARLWPVASAGLKFPTGRTSALSRRSDARAAACAEVRPGRESLYNATKTNNR